MPACLPFLRLQFVFPSPRHTTRPAVMHLSPSSIKSQPLPPFSFRHNPPNSLPPLPPSSIGRPGPQSRSIGSSACSSYITSIYLHSTRLSIDRLVKKMAARHHRELSSDEESAAAGDLRRGPWTVEEDMILVNYVAAHGEGRWNALARCAGLRRTGKSCRLRWLNYLRPDLRRGNITAQEQLLILELHSRWGNRWSKIAQHLPGRTDNEIKNYWRTRVQKHARQLNCDVNSQQFKDLMRYIWMPRLLERIGSGDGDVAAAHDAATPPPQPLLTAAAAAWHADDVELSCTTAVSSSSVSTDSIHHHHQQPVAVSPPPPAVSSAAFGQSNDAASYYGVDNSNTAMSMRDTLCQPPHSTPAQLASAGTCSGWSDESLLVVPSGLPGGGGGVYADMGFPDLCDTDTMWTAGVSGADDLWYTQIMGL